MSESPLPSVLTVKDISRYLKIGINSAYELVQDGTIFSVRIGRQYRIPRSALEQYLNQKPNILS